MFALCLDCDVGRARLEDRADALVVVSRIGRGIDTVAGSSRAKVTTSVPETYKTASSCQSFVSCHRISQKSTPQSPSRKSQPYTKLTYSFCPILLATASHPFIPTHVAANTLKACLTVLALKSSPLLGGAVASLPDFSTGGRSALSTAAGVGAALRSALDRERTYLWRAAYSRAEIVYRRVFRRMGSLSAREEEDEEEESWTFGRDAILETCRWIEVSRRAPIDYGRGIQSRSSSRRRRPAQSS